MKRQAYTLLEVLMALFLLSLICLMLLPAMTSGLKQQQSAKQDIDTRLVAQTMIERLKANKMNGNNMPLECEGYQIVIQSLEVKPGFIRHDILVHNLKEDKSPYELSIILPE